MPRIGVAEPIPWSRNGLTYDDKEAGKTSQSVFYVTIGAMVARELQRAKSLDGRPVADQVKQEVAAGARRLKEEQAITPRLAAVLVGDDPASAVYVRNKVRACAEVGIASEQIVLPDSTTTAELLAVVNQLNRDDQTDGILVQLPLPKQVDSAVIISSIDPAKDVDGFHPINIGLLAMGQARFVPCTPAGIIELLERNQIEIAGANACVVGRSQIVGRPVASLLLQKHATVTICHSQTRDLPSVTRQADILVAAIGRPAFIRGAFIKPGATVIDVGMNQVRDSAEASTLFGAEAERRMEAIRKRGFTLVGDVHPAEADSVAGSRTPVPGGVGLLTVAMLMKNTLQAAKWRRGL
ncbi:MAG TPA: bifunctional 5,10-methylenetetrahydrofolate dehydrogenase/5,10-methenyltetrahydrofolate cyclohydrolase [Pyrinomonadaceae bacterium]|nr:bifunctional 5,10-methylenetetrahydrofolate dehydrogenase/5,10-methenyltetrahydrofolate cyclohydrolase [Pyrinomonadaceae bacterium]